MPDLSMLPGVEWPRFLQAMILVLFRVGGMMVFAPVLSSDAIPARVKALFALAVAWLLAPVVSALPLAHAELGARAIFGELGIGFVLGFSLSMLSEILLFAGQLMGFQFSFSLVNLLDPNSQIETPLMSQMFSLLGTLVILGAGLHRTMLLALLRSFRSAPLGNVFFEGHSGLVLFHLLSGVFLAALELSAPVLAATMLVEASVAMLGRLSPQLPVMIISVPAKTLLGYIVLIGSLALWPRFLEGRFNLLLDGAERLVR
ncbi:flagellar biosynthetic protein FliR [Silvibacterium acidisoli]|uniref:flagellar biosynthetic protein FliR n=1 Tax=Acidobacteriaceae bacterium ZG23-2 TaxID=2883246 RepID=UPI00406C3508